MINSEHLVFFNWPVTVYYEDTDAGGVVYHSIYLNYMERARTEWLAALGISLADWAVAKQELFVVKSIEISYKAAARLGNQLIVTSHIHQCTKTRLLFAQSIYHQQRLLTAAKVEIVCVDSLQFRPKVLPERILQEFSL